MVTPAPTSPAGNLIFRSEKSRNTALIIWLPATFLLVCLGYFLFSEQDNRGLLFTTGLYLIIYFSLAWMWFDTGYAISDTVLFYHSGFIKGKIAINSIRKIEKKQEIFGGLKPALGSRGIIIHYRKFDDIYLSPENQEAFVEALKNRNPAIELAL